MMISAEWIMTLAGFILSILIFSLIFGDNGLFRFAGSILSGAIAAGLILILIEKVFSPYLILPLLDDRAEPELRIVSVICVGLILILIFTHYRDRNAPANPPWLTIGFFALTAVASAGAISGTFLPLLGATIAPFAKSGPSAAGNGVQWAEAIAAFAGVITALIWSREVASERSDAPGVFSNLKGKPFGGKLLFALERIGEIFVAAAFGAIFAGVFISSAIVLIDRLDLLLSGGRTILGGLLP